MLKSSTIAAVLIAFACTPLCFAQTKPADPQPLAGVKSINLQLEATSPEEAFAELARQADMQIKPMNQNLWAKADPVELKIENGRFWPVFMDMCQQANVHFNPMHFTGDPRTVQLFDADQGMDSITKCPNAQVQGCIIVLISVNRNYTLSYASPTQTNSTFGIQAVFLADPGLDLAGNLQSVITEAVDENGASFVQQNTPQGFFAGQGRASLARNLLLNLSCPANAGKKLVRLKGEIRTAVVVKTETLAIDLPMEATPLKKDLASMSVEITSVTPVANGAEVQVVMLSKRPMRGMDHENMWNTLARIELVDAEGNHYGSAGIRAMGNSSKSIEATVHFFGQKQMGKPVKLIWTLPVQTTDIHLPFEFKDLPIP